MAAKLLKVSRMRQAVSTLPRGTRGDLTSAGFTLTEMMVVIVMIAVLTSVAIVAFRRHLRSSRIVEAQALISLIVARQEAYFQQNGQYCNVSADTGGTDQGFYPLLVSGAEPQAKTFAPSTSGWQANWYQLAARPENGISYFVYNVRASRPAGSPAHLLEDQAATLGIPAQPTAAGTMPHPWYYVIAHANLDNTGGSYTNGGCSPVLGANACTTITATSSRTNVVVQNEGQ